MWCARGLTGLSSEASECRPPSGALGNGGAATTGSARFTRGSICHPVRGLTATARKLKLAATTATATHPAADGNGQSSTAIAMVSQGTVTHRLGRSRQPFRRRPEAGALVGALRRAR